MKLRRPPKILLLGMMTKIPVAGVVWQNVHYLVGLQRLGYEVYYVEAHARTPSMFMETEYDDGSGKAAAFIASVMEHFDLGDRWAFQALHESGQCYGMSETRLKELYRSADLIINLHGGTAPLPEHYETGRLVYLETDPVELQIELYDNLQSTIEFLEPHCAFFTFGENYGNPDCELPVSDRFPFRPTRQPVVLDFWQRGTEGDKGTRRQGDRTQNSGLRTQNQAPQFPHSSLITHHSGLFTTIGNWKQPWWTVTFQGEVYSWSKHDEFMKFLDLPEYVGQQFELALSSYDEADQRMLESKGWRVRPALSFSTDIAAYHDYIANSRGEFTVAKDQNIRLRSGWFSDRSATYLAAGRPVITQETGFSNILPTGEGLFSFSTLEAAVQAVERVASAYEQQCRAAYTIAREYFSYDIVLPPLLAHVGL